jgi:hypothetical protein
MRTRAASSTPVRRVQGARVRAPAPRAGWRAGALGLLLAGVAGAYVLPQGSILRRMADARDELQLTSLKAEGTFTFSGAAARPAGAALGLQGERPELQVDGVLFLRLPGRCRIEASVPEGARLALVQSHGRRKAEGGPAPAALTVMLEEVCALFTPRSGPDGEARAALDRHLRARKVEPRGTSLARFGGQVAYVLGDPAEGQPQVWVYKSDFRPARVRFSDEVGVAWDVRFIDYASPATGEALPRQVEVWRAGERLLRFTAVKGDPRAALPDALFAL